MTKEQFNNIDLRKQLTEDLKSKWYFKNIESELKVYKHHVVFDNDFKFVLTYHPAEIANETKEVLFEGYLDIRAEDGHRPSGMNYVETDNYYDYDKYADDPNDILEHIVLYIANCI